MRPPAGGRGAGRRVTAVLVASVLLIAGCGSSSGQAASGGSRTYTVGLLTDVTGLGASSNSTSVKGVEAGIALARADGYDIRYVLADTTSLPSGALVAAQKLVDQDHVLAVIAISGLTFAAASYLQTRHVPVVGVAQDGPEWTTDDNMFSVVGALHTTEVSTTMGQFFKREGGTTLGTLGYSISPSSAEAARAAAASAKYAGLRVGYLNADFPLGSTNVEPVAFAMKAARVDALTVAVEPNTAYALITALRQISDPLKVALLTDGYGGDLLQAGPGAMQQAQNVYFSLGFEPVEMHTPATEKFQKYLRTVGVDGDPTFAEYIGYTSVGLLVQGSRGTDAPVTRASLMTGLSKVVRWTAVGLFGDHVLDVNDRTGIVSGVGNCMWVTKLVSDHFQLVAGADPVCGSVLSGVTVRS